ncbi:MAG: D-alanyl-D-alanine carboxypeptidase family protein [Clostridiales bacterium]|nr:D-alanyl-D-alanine carboxypeptidase family protein [Clostridiales bacterium]
MRRSICSLLIVSALILSVLLPCTALAGGEDMVFSDDASDFVLLSEAVPDAILEIRYYSTYNFIGDRIEGYEQPVALLTKEAAAALKEVSDDVMSQGYRLKIFDAYRPQKAVTHFMRWALDVNDTRMKEYFYPELDKDVLFPQGYIAEHSGHSRGSTVDLTLFDMASGREVDMGGTFDYFGELSHPDYTDITETQYNNRMILRDAMLRHGFKPLAEEWWHFTLKDEPFKNVYFTFPVHSASVNRNTGIGSVDYMALVNKLNALPEGWEDALTTVMTGNSVGDEIEVEVKAFAAYEALKADLEENDGIYLELDSARRSVAEQQDIMDRFIIKYGADYAAKTVAVPGYSEHQTGLALDLYFKVKDENGAFRDVYYNEDMMKPEYEGIWDRIHEKLASYGFILRYLKDKEYITGYGYEPWHIRYIDDIETAKEIMAQPGMTLEVYLGAATDADPVISTGESTLFTQEELAEAAVQIKCKFASWEKCELHSLVYAGDDACDGETLEWLNSRNSGASFTRAAKFVCSFRTAGDIKGAWEPDTEYDDCEWYLAKAENGSWEIVNWIY